MGFAYYEMLKNTYTGILDGQTGFLYARSLSF
jgi:hypothetical protein